MLNYSPKSGFPLFNSARLPPTSLVPLPICHSMYLIAPLPLWLPWLDPLSHLSVPACRLFAPSPTLSAACLSVSISSPIIALLVRQRTSLTSHHLSDLHSARSLSLPSSNLMWHLIFTCWTMKSVWLITMLSLAFGRTARIHMLIRARATSRLQVLPVWLT